MGSRLTQRRGGAHECLGRDVLRGERHHPAGGPGRGGPLHRPGQPARRLGSAHRLRETGRSATWSATWWTPPRATSRRSRRRGPAARPAPYGLTGMHERAGEQATRFRDLSQQEMLARLRTDLDKLMGILEPMGPEEWTGFIVPHFYMGPVPAFFYAAGPADGLRRALLGHPAGHRARARAVRRRGRPAGAVHVRALAVHHQAGRRSHPVPPGRHGDRPERGQLPDRRVGPGDDATSRGTSATCPRSSTSTRAAWC